MSTNNAAGLKRHPLSAMCGDMSQPEYDELIASIEADSSNVVVMVYDGQVLDGWHRFTACRVAGVTPRFVEFDGDDPRGHVIRENVLRRHLDKAQRAAIVVRIRGWRPHGMQPGQSRDESGRLTEPDPPNGGSGDPPPATTAEMAAEAGVGSRTIERAKAVVRRDERRDKRIKDAGLTPHVDTGQVTVEQADDIISTGLNTPVLAGTLTPKDAAKHAASDLAEQREPPEATPVTEPVDVLAAAKQRIDDLEDENTMLLAQSSEQEHERHQTFKQLQAVNGALRSSVHECQTKYVDLQRSHRGAIKRIKELEGQS